MAYGLKACSCHPLTIILPFINVIDSRLIYENLQNKVGKLGLSAMFLLYCLTQHVINK